METTIQFVDLHRHFGRVRALDGLNLEVQVSEIYGFLGSNGAGKSITLRVLLGLARTTSGRAAVLGLDPYTGSGVAPPRGLRARRRGALAQPLRRRNH
jgi:ABC-2 type transport system ATP-binding protein